MRALDATLAVTALAPAQTVAIPTGLVAASTAVSPGPRAPELANSPLIIRFTAPTFPTGTTVTVSRQANCGDALGHGDPCGLVVGALAHSRIGAYTVSDADSSYAYGFETFTPGPGSGSIYLIAKWAPVSTGFAGIRVGLNENAYNLIAWSKR